MTVLIEMSIVVSPYKTMARGRNHHLSTSGTDTVHQRIGIIGFVGQYGIRLPAFQKWLGLRDVGNFRRQLPHSSPANAQDVPVHRRPHESYSFIPHASALLLDGLLFLGKGSLLQLDRRMGAYRRAVDPQRFPVTIAREILIYLQTK